MAHAKGLVAPLILLLLTVGFYWKLALTSQYVWFDHPDMAYLETPRLQFQARQIHAGRFPLWDPHIWGGQPLIGQTQPGPLYPLNLLFYLAPLQDGYLRFAALNRYYVAIHFLAALFCYWLCRDLKRSKTASIVAACAFSFGGFMGTVPWLDVLNGGVWTPLVFLFLFRALLGERPATSAALCGLFLGVAWLSGHHELPLLCSIAVAAFWLAEVARRRTWRAVRLAGSSLLIAALVSAVQVWPAYEFGKIATRWVGADQPVKWADRVPYTIHTIYSLPARGLLATILPGNAGAYGDTAPFLGIAVVALALLGLAACWSEKPLRWLVFLLIAAVVYALGALTLLHGVLYSLSLTLSKARLPVRAIHFLNFAIAVLAAYGVDALLDRTAAVWVRRLSWAVAAFGALILGAAVVLAVALKSGFDDRMLLTGFIACALAILMPAYTRQHLNRGLAAVLLVAFVLTELTPVIMQRFPSRFDKDRNRFSGTLLQNRDIAAYLRAQPQPLRVVVNDTDIPVNFGDLHGIDTLGGYVAGVTNNLVFQELHTKRTQSLFGVTHHVGAKPARADQQEVFNGAGGIKVFRNPDPMPKAWTVHQLERVPSGDHLRIAIQNPAFDFSRKAAMLGAVPPLANCAGGDAVTLESRTTDRLRLSARMNCRGMLIVGDPFYPGWVATVDENPAEILEAYGVLRGVIVEAGSHQVEMRYRPLSVLGGGILTLAGALLTAFIAWSESRNQTKRTTRQSGTA